MTVSSLAAGTTAPPVDPLPVKSARRWGVCLSCVTTDGAVFLSCNRWSTAALAALIRQYYPGPFRIETISEDAFDEIWAKRYGVDAGLESPESFRPESQDPSGALPIVEAFDESSGAARLLDALLVRARRLRATDIHLESRPQGRLAIRMRVDGLLQPVPSSDHSQRLRGALLARLKVLAQLNLAETRRFQDGRFRHRWAGEDGGHQDCRVSIVPGRFGENAVIRLLPASGVPPLAHLGWSREQYALIRSVLTQPQGLILVSGPTGSGKTTTMHAMLKHIASPSKKVVTIEDPVEYILSDAVQIQVRPELGMDFNAALRAVLRHDPDIILVGEIRDAETAATALRTAMTGHFVLSTVHTNDAAGVMERLLDMGVPPYLLGAGLSLVIHQRLVRRCCACRRKDGDEVTAGVCPHCRGRGYCGRTAVFECCLLDERAKRDIARGVAPVLVRRRLAARTVSLEQAARIKVQEHITDEAEVRRCLGREERRTRAARMNHD